MLRERRCQMSYQVSGDVSSRSAYKAENASDLEARVADRRPEETGPGFQIPDHRELSRFLAKDCHQSTENT